MPALTAHRVRQIKRLALGEGVSGRWEKSSQPVSPLHLYPQSPSCPAFAPSTQSGNLILCLYRLLGVFCMDPQRPVW